MCADVCCLALRLQAPLLSFGNESQFNRRQTAALPSKSAVAGMLCAAKGLYRGSTEEQVFLGQIATMHMLAVAVPRQLGARGRGWVLTAGRTVDFHTVQGTRRATGGIKDCHLTWRHYLHDSAFGVFLNGPRSVLEEAAKALQNPVWGLWIGRKCCIPSVPVFGGLFASEAEALDHMLDAPLECFTHEREVDSFEKGNDSVSDQAESFCSAARSFAPRRVMRVRARAQAGQGGQDAQGSPVSGGDG